MKFRHYLYIFLTIIVVSIQNIKAQTLILSDEANISLLTNSPWDEEIYAIFGHTAIRVNDPINNLDIAFNYGTFDFDSPNFISRFIKGETDYWLTIVDFDNYLYSYKFRGVGVTEQILNLTKNEKQKIFDALVINSLPENREYRYNYFYDNCSTRPRDIIENNINGSLEYRPTDRKQTYRDLIHQQVNRKVWIKFGIDLIIGADADKIITDKQKDFLPVYLKNSFESARIINKNDSTRNLVLTTNLILPDLSKNKDNTEPLNIPFYVGLVILFIAIFISFYCSKKRFLISKLFDFILFFVAGLVGCVIFFLMFFSIHPCTNPNWNIIWLNPLQLIFSFLFLIKAFAKCTYYYHFINFVLLSLLFLVWFLIPQSLELAFLPFIVSLWVRSGANIIQYKKSINNTK